MKCYCWDVVNRKDSFELNKIFISMFYIKIKFVCFVIKLIIDIHIQDKHDKHMIG